MFCNSNSFCIFCLETQCNSTVHKLSSIHAEQRETTYVFFLTCKIPYVSLKMFFSKHSPSWFIFDFAYTFFPAFYGASLSMGGVSLICGFPNLGTVSMLRLPSVKAFAAAEHRVVPETQYSPQGLDLSSLLAGIRFWTL